MRTVRCLRHRLANNDARTEGMSYGMMIAVELDKKREFDALWNWAKSYMLITDPKNPSVGYFAWSMGTTDRRARQAPRRTAKSISPWRSTLPRTAG